MVIAYERSGTAAGDNDGHTYIAYPSSNADDIFIAVCYIEASTGVPTPSGWTLGYEANDTNRSLQIFWKRALGTESGNVVFDHDTSTEEIAANISVFSGCITTGSPLDTGYEGSGTDDAMVASLSPAPSVDDCMILFAGGMSDNNNKTSMTSGWSEAYFYKEAAGDDCLVSLQYKLQTTKSTESSVTLDTNANDPWLAIIIPLKPPEVAGGGDDGGFLMMGCNC